MSPETRMARRRKLTLGLRRLISVLKHQPGGGGSLGLPWFHQSAPPGCSAPTALLLPPVVRPEVVDCADGETRGLALPAPAEAADEAAAESAFDMDMVKNLSLCSPFLGLRRNSERAGAAGRAVVG